MLIFHIWCNDHGQKRIQLDNVAINDVLPLKAARRDTIANLKYFWGLGHQIPNFDGYIYI